MALALCLMLVAFLPGVAEEAGITGRTFVGRAINMDISYTPYEDAPMETDVSRLLVVTVWPEDVPTGSATYLVYLPEGEKPADYIGYAIRFHIPDGGAPDHTGYYIVDRIERLAQMSYGEIRKLGEGFVEIEPYYGLPNPDGGSTVRFEITEDTRIYHPYSRGESIEIVVEDADAGYPYIALEINRANG